MVESSVTTSEYPQSHRGHHRGRCAFGDIPGSKAQHGPTQDPGKDKTLVVVYGFGDPQPPFSFRVSNEGC
jgi:hypothetical protein